MPTVFTHGLIGFTAATAWRPGGGAPSRRRVLLSLTLAVLPDVDGIPYMLGLIPNAHLLGHRGLTHSLPTALVLGAVAAAAMGHDRPRGVGLWMRYWVFFSAVAASHGLLDMATNGGSGIALLAPFSEERLFWPVRSISVSPIRPARWLTPFGVRAIGSELVTLWTLCGAALLMTRVWRRGLSGPAPLHWLTSAALVAMAILAWIAFAFQPRWPA